MSGSNQQTTSNRLSLLSIARDRSVMRRYFAAATILLAILGLSANFYRSDRTHVTSAAFPYAGEAFVREGNLVRIPEQSPLRRQLLIQAIAQKENIRDLVIPAMVEADPARLMKVLLPLAGRVTELNVRLGERVERGKPLLVLDSPDLYTASADYDRAKVLLDLAAKSQKRLHSLGVGGGISLKDVQQADADLISANAEFRRAEARLRQIGVDPTTSDKSRTVVIRAPISGSVLDLSVAPGAYWNDTTASLLTIADLSNIFVTANLPEKDTASVTEGQPVEVRVPAYPGEIIKGVVSFVSDALDSETRRTKVRIILANKSTRLKPGMFANVTFLSPKELVLIVPTRALVLKEDESQVWVEVAPWTFEARPVDVRFEKKDQAIVQSGLQAGDRVIVRGAVLLND